MNFVLFLLLNVVLLCRPEELFPDLAGTRIYLIVITLCTVTSFHPLLAALSPSSLRERPLAVCVLLFLAATVASNLFLGRFDEEAVGFVSEFAKVILYYFLFLAVVDTPGRFRLFVATLIGCVVALTAIALAQHYQWAYFPNITECTQAEVNPETGETFILKRLVSTGIFNDPNDLCLMLGLGTWCCIYRSTTAESGWVERLAWLTPIPLFGFALVETHSRGGMLGVLGGGAAYLFARFGGTRGLPLAAAGALAALTLVQGRQGSVEGGGTAHQRLMLWADGLIAIGRQPFYLPTGLGIDWYVNETGHVAHNSFVTAYIELGLLGGGAYLGMFLFAGWLLHLIGREIPAPAWAVRARAFAFAVTVGYAVGCYSLTRNFVVPTYLILGIASAVLAPAGPYLPELYRVDGKWFLRMAGVSVAGFVVIRVLTQALGLAGV
jgi:hypothetical protein